MQDDTRAETDAQAPATGIRRRRFLGVAGLAVGVAALAPLVVSRLGGSGGWSLPDFSQQPPFSFTYDGAPSSELLPQWQHRRTTAPFAHGRERIDTWTDPETGLRVALTSRQHATSGAVSWVVRFHNDSSTDSLQIADVLALDLTHTVQSLQPWTVHTSNGSDSQDVDFTPLDVPLPDQGLRVFSTANGRPSDGVTDVTISIPWSHRTGDAAAGSINSDQHATTVAGATASLTFEGSSVTWIGVQNVDCGKADVLIDGEEVAVIDQYAASWLKQVELFTKDDLPAGQHTITVRAREDKNPCGQRHQRQHRRFRRGHRRRRRGRERRRPTHRLRRERE